MKLSLKSQGKTLTHVAIVCYKNIVAGNATAKRRRPPNSWIGRWRMTRYERMVVCIMLADLIVNVLTLIRQLM